MANLGADFNASKPTEADFVRHPSKPNLATEIRFIRSRLKSFLGAVMDLESGDFKDSVVPQAALVEHPDKPDSAPDFYREVTVDARGFVVKGGKDAKIYAPRIFRAVYASDGSIQESETGLIRDPAANNSQWPVGKLLKADSFILPLVREYRFFAPKNVTRIQVVCVGGGLKGSASAAGENARVSWISFSVVPGEQYRVLVGQPDAPSAFSTMDYVRYVTSEGYTNNILGGSGVYLDKRNIYNFKRPPYRPFGFGGAVNALGTPGMVLLEWYA
jgi:hypothetical protein